MSCMDTSPPESKKNFSPMLKSQINMYQRFSDNETSWYKVVFYKNRRIEKHH